MKKVQCYTQKRDPRRGWLGHQAWMILVGRAMNHQVITYGELEALMDHPIQFLGQNALWPVAAYCNETYYDDEGEKLPVPPLTNIVVSKNRSMPGKGFPNDPKRLVEVLQFNRWHLIVPPSPEELDAAWRRAEGQDV